MRLKRAHVILPEDLLTDVDQLAGPGQRSTFLAEIIRQEVHRLKLSSALREARGSWKIEDHPELQDGSDAFIERLRAEKEDRLEGLRDD